MGLVTKIFLEKWQASIRTKLVTLFTLLIALIATFITTFFPYQQERDQLKDMCERAESIAEITAFNIAPALYFNDVDAIKEIFNSTKQLKDIVYMVVLDRSGRIVEAYNKEKADEVNFFQIYGDSHFSEDGLVYKTMTPVILNGKEIGKLYLGLSLQKLRREIQKIRLVVLAIGIFILGLGFAAVTAISTVVTGPLNEIVKTAKEIARGDLSKRAPVLSKDEVGYLAETFNRMIDNLERAYEELERINRSLERLVDDRTRELQQEIKERIRAEKALEEMLEFERLIATISARFINLSHEEIDSGIRKSLGEIGKFVEADRCYVVLLSKDGSSMSDVYEWCAEGVKSQIENRQDFLAASFPWWMEKMKNMECICITSVDELPPEASEVKAILNAQDIKSIAAVPLVFGGELVGFLGFDSMREERKWSEDTIASMRVVGEIIANAIGRKRAYEELKRSYEKVKKSMISTVNAMSKVIELRDPYTAGHQQRVAKLAYAIAKEMGLPEDRIIGIQLAALIHDIGKMYIPAEILTKPGKLTDIEFEMIKAHPELGYNALKMIDFPWPIAEIIRQHHERLDGSGYPRGLKRDEILLEARIIGVADVVEAMASHRPYRPALGVDAALEEITKNKGKLYDPVVVDICVKLFREKGFNFDTEGDVLSALFL